MTEAASEEKRRRGRPANTGAISHEKILDAVQEILQDKSVRELTMEEVAKRAGVGKPTIYKWWPSKTALVLDLFEERMVPSLAVPNTSTAEEAIRGQVKELIRLLNGFFGKVARDLIAEGQSDPNVLQEYQQRYVSKRRAFTRDAIEKAKTSGEFRRDVDSEALIDMIYGPIYYRLLLGHQPLTIAFGNKLVDDVLACTQLR